MSYEHVPERAVILAAGLGSRLRPFTNSKPKPLVPVHGTPILHNALRNPAKVGVKETTIVVGYRKEAIQSACGTSFAGMDIRYIVSTVFDRTGSAYSLWLARDVLLIGDVLLLEGDVFFELAVLDRLLGAGDRDVAAVAPFDPSMTGSAVTLSGSTVLEFRTNQTPADAANTPLYKTLNVVRFKAETLGTIIVPGLDDLVASGASRAFVEQLLADLIRDRGLRLGAALCGDCRWFEIDSKSDLRAAEHIFASSALAAHSM